MCMLQSTMYNMVLANQLAGEYPIKTANVVSTHFCIHAKVQWGQILRRRRGSKWQSWIEIIDEKMIYSSINKFALKYFDFFNKFALKYLGLFFLVSI